MRVAHSKRSFDWLISSHRPHCEVRLRVRDMIPLLSWLLIRVGVDLVPFLFRFAIRFLSLFAVESLF